MSLYLGIDIASVDKNKLVDWTAAKAAGVRFAIFRGTYITWADPTWKKEADRAREAGITVGAYMFPVMDKTAPSAKDQVAAFAKATGATYKLGDLPPTLDVEYSQGIAKTGRTRAELLAWVREAVEELKKLFGIKPMLYTSKRVWDGEDKDSLNVDALGTPTPDLLECPLWLARYPYAYHKDAVGDEADEKSVVENLPKPPVPAAWVDNTNVWIHQYQGDAIHLPGFSNTVDLNRFFDLRKGSKGERVKWMQKKLHIVADGDFGPATLNAVESFQRVNKLIPDGIVGPKTFAYLCWVKLS